MFLQLTHVRGNCLTFGGIFDLLHQCLGWRLHPDVFVRQHPFMVV